nr:MAG TPA: pentapeptide repeat protein [Caudoviricetes sp.]
MSKQIKIEIKNRWTGSILFEYLSENNTIKKTVSEAIKSGADLCEAYLCEAYLCEADLRGADLRGADLREADLREADLRGADLCGADLREADLRGAKGAYMACPTDGSFIGWKKASGYIVKLQIPEDARRSSAGGEKCRCDKAYVAEIQNTDGTKADIEAIHSNRGNNFVYTVGATVEVPDFDDDRWKECAPGIHFFIDRRVAVEY